MKKEPHHARPTSRPIPLRNLLGDLDPNTCKLHCAVSDGNVEPINELATDWDEWVGWSRWRGARDHFNRVFIFTMARVPKTSNHWLFGGVFEVTGRSPIANARSYDLKLRDDIMGEYIKRLVIDFRPTGRFTRRNMETDLDQMTVAAIHDKPYEGDAFPGHDLINHTFRDLRTIVRQSRPDWRIALESMKGVYVIHDQLTGEPYGATRQRARGQRHHYRARSERTCSSRIPVHG
ncbi:hypothetical protein H7J86_21030 [Mycobacterium hackensackense]|uniref:hypothetical protein n=1 Tax=Mycobacterium hackensackense TaxID=228909 RepID=UPI002265F480|nr:hypothetical protein [Mycobacterium hackensackense]MCV7254648.1 hypothetical protein [Mycobacterium hackensackense]